MSLFLKQRQVWDWSRVNWVRLMSITQWEQRKKNKCVNRGRSNLNCWRLSTWQRKGKHGQSRGIFKLLTPLYCQTPINFRANGAKIANRVPFQKLRSGRFKEKTSCSVLVNQPSARFKNGCSRWEYDRSSRCGPKKVNFLERRHRVWKTGRIFGYDEFRCDDNWFCCGKFGGSDRLFSRSSFGYRCERYKPRHIKVKTLL